MFILFPLFLLYHITCKGLEHNLNIRKSSKEPCLEKFLMYLEVDMKSDNFKKLPLQAKILSFL